MPKLILSKRRKRHRPSPPVDGGRMARLDLARLHYELKFHKASIRWLSKRIGYHPNSLYNSLRRVRRGFKTKVSLITYLAFALNVSPLMLISGREDPFDDRAY